MKKIKPMGPLTIVAPCELHESHKPRPAYCEIHHVIPQAWQLYWQPPDPWPNSGQSPDHAGVTLWDARTVTVCRTGHGNVHYWLVKLMHAIVDEGISADAIGAVHVVRADLLKEGHEPGHLDLEWAVNAITRYTEVGGSIEDLAANHLWGQI